MSGKPEDAAKRDVAALAAELAGQIASLSAFAGSGLASQGFAGARPGSTAGAPAFTGPRTMLENAARFVSPVLPAGAALRPVKAALLRVLRIVTRDQTTFNSALLEALRGALLETEASLNGFASVSAEAREAARHAEAATVAASACRAASLASADTEAKPLRLASVSSSAPRKASRSAELKVVWSRVTIRSTRRRAALTGRSAAPAGSTGDTKRAAFSSIVRGPVNAGAPAVEPGRAPANPCDARPEPANAESDAI